MTTNEINPSTVDDILSGRLVVSGNGLTEAVRASRIIAGEGLVATPVGHWVQLAGTVVGRAWHTLLDLDFSAQTAATFDTDGTVTIGGTTWTVANATNLYSGRSAMAIVPGSGLRTARAATGEWYNQAWPLLRWELPAQVVNGVPLRVCAQAPAEDTGTSWRGSMVCLAAPYATAYDRYCTGVARTSRGDVDQVQVAAQMHAYGVSHTPSGQPDLWANNAMLPDWSYDLYGLDFPEGVGYGPRHHATWGQSAQGHRDNLNLMTRFSWFPLASSYNAFGYVSQASPATFQAENWGVVLMGSDDAAPQDIIRSVKVEAFY